MEIFFEVFEPHHAVEPHRCQEFTLRKAIEPTRPGLVLQYEFLEAHGPAVVGRLGDLDRMLILAVGCPSPGPSADWGRQCQGTLEGTFERPPQRPPMVDRPTA